MTTQTLTYRFTLDTFRNGVQRILQGFQTGEDVSRKMEISLVSGSDTYLIPLSNVVASMYVKRPSQTEPSVNACVIDNNANKIIYEVQPEDITEEGTVTLQLKLISTLNGDEETIISPMFGMEVWESQIDDSDAEGTTTYTSLTQALAAAESVSHSAITEFVIDDDNIIVVTFGDGSTYESTVIKDALATISDIEDYVERAETAATNAESSETNAGTYASSALASKNSAGTSESNALASATSASASASAALTSANNASSSAASALASMGSAKTYSESAESYKNAASTSASNASTSESNASTSASNALTYSENASASASSASTSASNATTSENNASSYATLSKSYAVGNTSSRAGEDNDNAKHYKEMCEQIASGLQGGFIPMGTVTFANLPTTVTAGWMYNVSDEFTSDSRFKDGGNKKYASGTNVYVTADSMWDCLSGAVPTVNGKNGNSITLDGSDILVTGYSKATTESAIGVTDSINVALGKLEKKADEVSNKISSAVSGLGEVLTYKGTVATYADLPANAQAGWVYHVTSEGTNYAYEVEPDTLVGAWSEMGQHVDLSGYVTTQTFNNALNGYKLVVTTRTAYDAMASHDANTIYFFKAEA